MRNEETPAPPGGNDLPIRRFAAFVVVALVMLASLLVTRSNGGLAVLAPLGVVALGGAMVLWRR